MGLSMLIGGICRLCYGDGDKSSENGGGFDPEVFVFNAAMFYYGFLPPIIFNQGYHLKRKLFFENFLGICMLSVVGTCISVALIGGGIYWFNSLNFMVDQESPQSRMSWMECIAFGALLASTDPVATLAVYADLKGNFTYSIMFCHAVIMRG
jgi:NhaP-type Na+/H+ or K+/H+ antiporter